MNCRVAASAADPRVQHLLQDLGRRSARPTIEVPQQSLRAFHRVFNLQDPMRSNPLKLILLAQIAIATICGLPVLAGPQLTPADYVDPTIGNLAAFLRPTYPTVHQPNQMLRTYPIKAVQLPCPSAGNQGIFPWILSRCRMGAHHFPQDINSGMTSPPNCESCLKRPPLK